MWEVDGTKVVTTCGEFNTRGDLIMGKGAALEAKQRFPMLPNLAARAITDRFQRSEYNFIYIPECPIGLLQTKYGWRDPSYEPLVKRSIAVFGVWASRFGGTLVLNFPGIGLGGLSKEILLPYLELHLEDNVVVCEYD